MLESKWGVMSNSSRKIKWTRVVIKLVLIAQIMGIMVFCLFVVLLRIRW